MSDQQDTISGIAHWVASNVSWVLSALAGLAGAMVAIVGRLQARAEKAKQEAHDMDMDALKDRVQAMKDICDECPNLRLELVTKATKDVTDSFNQQMNALRADMTERLDRSEAGGRPLAGRRGSTTAYHRLGAKPRCAAAHAHPDDAGGFE